MPAPHSRAGQRLQEPKSPSSSHQHLHMLFSCHWGQAIVHKKQQPQNKTDVLMQAKHDRLQGSINQCAQFPPAGYAFMIILLSMQCNADAVANTISLE
jgi:hypothetical protein